MDTIFNPSIILLGKQKQKAMEVKNIIFIQRSNISLM